tara:strand:- start:855 stop:1181 length:327 start_codon:yes stop_codon:yes gene_type:complete
MAYYGDNAVHAWGCAGDNGDLSDGFNIADIVDNGTGDMTADFTNNAANTNYATTLTSQSTSNNCYFITVIRDSQVDEVRMRGGFSYYSNMAFYDWGDKSYQFVCLSSY